MVSQGKLPNMRPQLPVDSTDESIDRHLSALDRDGFAVVPGVLSAAEVAEFVSAADNLSLSATDVVRGGYRDLFGLMPEVRRLATHPALRRWPDTVLGPGAFAVRAILFDKTPAANWKVAWHQDLTIAVRRRLDAPGFGPWSVKEGIHHVQPPVEVLEAMLTVRLHLDPCGPENGPIRMLPGSHRDGKLTSAQIDAWKSRAAPIELSCPAAGLVLMRPLIVHASSPATKPSHRRVIHLEYAARDLPHGLDWYERRG